MKYVRWIGIIILILILGYLSAFGLFADSSIGGLLGLGAIFVAGCAAIGFLIPKYWQLSGLGSWGAVLLTILEVGSTLLRGTVPGQQPVIQVLLTGVGAIAFALLGGYIGYRIKRGR
jgi:hypothetical protein